MSTFKQIRKKGPLWEGRALRALSSVGRSAAFLTPYPTPEPPAGPSVRGRTCTVSPHNGAAAQSGRFMFLIPEPFQPAYVLSVILRPRTHLVLFCMYQAFSLMYVISVVTHKFAKHSSFLFTLQAVNALQAARDGVYLCKMLDP